MTNAEYTRANERRVNLIARKCTKGLSVVETLELDRLQRECEKHLSAKHPLPTDELADFEQLLAGRRKDD